MLFFLQTDPLETRPAAAGSTTGSEGRGESEGFSETEQAQDMAKTPPDQVAVCPVERRADCVSGVCVCCHPCCQYH